MNNNLTYQVQLKVIFLLFVSTFVSIFWVSKSFTIENFGIRPEDIPSICIVMFFPFAMVKFGKKIPKLYFLSIGFYFYYLLIVSFFNSPDYFFSFIVLLVKEFSYFAYFLLALIYSSHLPSNQLKSFFQVILFLCIPTLIYVLYQIFFGPLGMYGFSIFGHGNSPASAGLIALTIYFFSYIYSQLFKFDKFVLFFIIVSPIVVLIIGSKLAAIGLISFTISNVLLDNNRKNFFYGCAFLLLIFLILVASINSGIASLHRLDGIFHPIDIIMNRGIWFKVDWIENLITFLFGHGLSIGHINELTGSFSFGMAMDNQFLYFVLVMGLIGTLIYLFMLFLLIESHPIKSIQKRLQISLIVSFFCMGMGAEVFQLSISGIIFWIISGILVGSSMHRIRTLNDNASFS